MEAMQPTHSHTIDVQTNPDQQQQQYKLKTRSTGTTIAAVLSNNSKVLILAADTRATDDTTVADKRCEKLHALAKKNVHAYPLPFCHAFLSLSILHKCIIANKALHRSGSIL